MGIAARSHDVPEHDGGLWARNAEDFSQGNFAERSALDDQHVDGVVGQWYGLATPEDQPGNRLTALRAERAKAAGV